MTLFRHKSYDASGKSISGVVDADSPRQATSKLKNKGLFPFEVTAELSSRGRAEQIRRPIRRVSKAEITTFTRQLATLLASGMPLVESLTALSEQTDNQALEKAIVDIKGNVSSGSSLSDTLGGYPRYFSPTYVGLVKAGEEGGDLDIILEELAQLGEKEEALKGKVLAAMIYPLVMVIVGILVLAILFVAVIPQITSIFENMGQALPLPTRILITTANIAQQWWPLILIAVVLISFACYKAYHTKKGRTVIDRLALRLPVFGSVLCRIDVARFSRSLSLLLKGGVPITDALDTVKGVVKSSIISDSISRARENLAEGGDISSVLKERGIFPPIAVHMIAIGEKGGKLEEMLLNVANAFDREVERVAEGLTSILEPLLILAMGGIVFFIALSILLPIFEMNSLVG